MATSCGRGRVLPYGHQRQPWPSSTPEPVMVTLSSVWLAAMRELDSSDSISEVVLNVSMSPHATSVDPASNTTTWLSIASCSARDRYLPAEGRWGGGVGWVVVVGCEWGQCMRANGQTGRKVHLQTCVQRRLDGCCILSVVVALGAKVAHRADAARGHPLAGWMNGDLCVWALQQAGATQS